MIPWEREVYLVQLRQHLEEQEKEREKNK